MLQLPDRLPVRPLLFMAALGLIAGGCRGANITQAGPVVPITTAVAQPTAPPTPTPTPEPTDVAPTTTALKDKLNDGLNCVTGQPLAETPPGVDISRAVVEVLPAGSDGEVERVQFTIELDQAPPLDMALFGGVEFADTDRAISSLNPQWHLDGIGNQNFSFSIRGSNVVPELHQFDPVSGWAANANTGF